MTYATLMVHLELGRSNAGLLRIAGDLVERFHAGVIGIAACPPMQLSYGDGYIVSGDVIEQDREETETEIKTAEAEFRNALQARARNIEWRSTVAYVSLSDYLAREARQADLVITCIASGDLLDKSRRVNTGELVLRVGRPVFIVPRTADALKLERIVLAWKDTRESRRAAFDALPLLKKAAHVSVVEITAEEELVATQAHLKDVIGWLGHHGVTADSIASPSTGNDATQLNAIAQEQDADVIVAGAYGHSRLREWVFGGVTSDLLLREDRCALVSH